MVAFLETRRGPLQEGRRAGLGDEQEKFLQALCASLYLATGFDCSVLDALSRQFGYHPMDGHLNVFDSSKKASYALSLACTCMFRRRADPFADSFNGSNFSVFCFFFY